MNPFRIFLSLSFFLYANSAVSKSSFDLLFDYSILKESNLDGEAKGLDGLSGKITFDDNFSGGNFGVSGLYSFLDSSAITPVIGLSLNVTSLVNIPNSLGVEYSIFDISTIGRVGVKFSLFKDLRIYGLGNIGYSPIKMFMLKSKTNAEIESFSNNYLYGASVVAAYEFFSSKSLGLGFTYNKKHFSGKFEKIGIKELKMDYNEFGVNLFFAIHW